MNNKTKIFVSAVLIVAVISMLWFVIPATPVWVISYIFALFAVVGIAASFLAYVKKATKVPQGHAFPITAGTYAVVSVLFSIVTVCFDYNGRHFPAGWYAIIHTVIFGFYVIRVISLLAGSEHIDKVDELAAQKHKELNKDKDSYWG